MTEIRLAQSGMGMTDGTIIAWHKDVGDFVAAGERLCDIEAAKSTVEFESPVSGIIVKILVNVDQNVPVNTVLAEVDENGADTKSPDLTRNVAVEADQIAEKSTAAKASPLARRVAADTGIDLNSIKGTGPKGKIRRDDVVKAVGGSASEAASTKPQIDPRARKAARDLNIDLADVTGSGPNGRIVVDDVVQYSKKLTAIAATDENVYTGESQTPAREIVGVTEVSHSMMRRIIAERLTESKQSVPHFYVKASCRIDELLELRTKLNASSDIKISINDFFIRAIACALADTPEANVTWGEKAMRKYDFVDISVAVATPGGLITPVIRSAEKKRLTEIAAEAKELADRGREGSLKPEDYQGGVTTISNLGMYGIEEFSAILNPPQSTIFAIGGGEKRMNIVDNQAEIATMVAVTMSVDHRAVDGAVAAQLMAAFKNYIENPIKFLL